MLMCKLNIRNILSSGHFEIDSKFHSVTTTLVMINSMSIKKGALTSTTRKLWELQSKV